MLKKLLIFFLTTLGFGCFSQPDNTNKFYFKFQPNYGFIMQHRNTMGHLVNGHIGGAELSMAKPTKGDKLWHYENNFPERGLAFIYTYLSNEAQLGDLYAIAPFYDIPLNKKKSSGVLHLRLSTGVAMLSKKFDPVYNHKNNVVSARLNAYVNFKWFYKIDLGERLRLETGLSFSHASNGKFKAPNLGINMLTAFGGLTYKIKEPVKKEIISIDSSSAKKSNHELYGIASIGLNETEPPGGPKFIAQSNALGYYYNKRNTHKFGGGLDVFYCESVAEDIYLEDTIRYSNKLKYIQVGIRASYSYNIGRVSFPVEFGRYLITPYKGDGMFYHRIGIRYYCKNNIMASLSLKTHWAVAHYFDIGIGYRLPLKK